MYVVEFTETAKQFLKKTEKKDSEIILKKIYSIKDNPFRFLKRLQGGKLWRLRIAEYRAIIDVIISANKIIVVRIGKRENVYD